MRQLLTKLRPGPHTRFARKLADLPTLALEGSRYVRTGLARKARGARSYDGSAEEICAQIVRELFDDERRYFRTSRSTYPEFWARDFGRAVPALLGLGFAEQVRDTYRYALETYRRAGRFALTITPWGRLFDFPYYAPDGFALFVFGLAELDDRALIGEYRELLEREIDRFSRVVVQESTGLVKPRVHFSEAQDYVVRSSSCYSNSMCFLLGRSLTRLGLPNPLERYDYPRLLRQHFLADDYFYDDLDRREHVAGDAALMPFWCKVIEPDSAGRVLLDRVLARIDRAGLNDPFPCRYGNSKARDRRMIVIERLNPWQRDAVWTCLGLQLLEVLREFGHDRYQTELDAYERMVERFRCFPEVIDAQSGDLFRGPLYSSEDSMIWAANLWHMIAEKPH